MKDKLDEEINTKQLQKKITNIDWMINEYSLLRESENSESKKKLHTFFIDQLIKQKLVIQQLINEMKEESELIL